MDFTTADLEYPLPEEAIAQSAREPRDAARLLVTSTLEDRVFSDLPGLLDPGDLVVVNTTRVRHARLRTTRADTGGRVEVLLLGRVGDARWRVMMRPTRRLRPGVSLVGDPTPDGDRLHITIDDVPVDGVATARIDPDADVEQIVAAVGEVPLPPYFHGDVAAERYQTIFADRVGSAAAPTAALHFTPAVLTGLHRRGVALAEVELEVGLDTFRPIAEGRLDDHRIHTERYAVPRDTADAIEAARERGGRVVAVGTTVTRTLESAADDRGGVVAGGGLADLFIVPGYRLRVVDGLITNFHAPRTTLIALVATLLGERWRDAYATALERGYRFLSFGDAMWIDEIEPGARRPS